MVASSNVVNPDNLPPTERAAHFHALRVHLQVTQWKNLSLTCLNPKDWGWKEKNGVMIPTKTDLEPAPSWLLQVVRCNCKTESRNPCGTRLCSCRKNGLTCVAACGGCNGENCENAMVEEVEEISEEHDDIDIERNIFDFLEDFN